MRLLLLLIFLLTHKASMAVEVPVGVVTKVRGEAFRIFKISTNSVDKSKNYSKKKKVNDTKRLLKEGMKLFQSDLLEVEKASFLKITLLDETIISIAPNTKIKISKFLYQNKKRQVLINLLIGKMKTYIRKKAKGDEKIKFKSKSASIGVRGTSFLFSTYSVKSKPTSDILLMTGKVETNVTGLNKVINLVPNEAINSLSILNSGNHSLITKISEDSLSLLNDTEEAFLPNMMDKNGKLIDLEKEIQKRFKKKVKAKVDQLVKPTTEPDLEEEQEDEEEDELVFDINVEVNEDSSEKED